MKKGCEEMLLTATNKPLSTLLNSEIYYNNIIVSFGLMNSMPYVIVYDTDRHLQAKRFNMFK